MWHFQHVSTTIFILLQNLFLKSVIVLRNIRTTLIRTWMLNHMFDESFRLRNFALRIVLKNWISFRTVCRTNSGHWKAFITKIFFFPVTFRFRFWGKTAWARWFPRLISSWLKLHTTPLVHYPFHWKYRLYVLKILKSFRWRILKLSDFSTVRIILTLKCIFQMSLRIFEHKDDAHEHQNTEKHLELDFSEFGVSTARCALYSRSSIPSIKSTWISTALSPDNT